MKRQLLVAAFIALGAARSLQAQTTAYLSLGAWDDGKFGETRDKALYQEQGHVKGEDDRGAQVFWWDSTGRFRFDTHDPNAFTLGYHYLTINFDTNSRTVPDTLDDLSLAAGIHLGQFGDWKTSAVVGLGYASDNLFADAVGLYGIAHLLFEKPLNANDSLVLGAFYDGNSGLFPDVPLPEFAYRHRGEGLDYCFGFPASQLRWTILPQLSLQANYTVPYSGDVTLEYAFAHGLSVFGNYTNAFSAFYIAHDERENRLFYEMQRVELGVRYQNPDIFHGIALDAALVVGYAFDQQLSRGFDVRDLDSFAELSDEPYIGIVLVGTY